jgi:single-stranded-DNA-specific exonuclease
MPKAHWKVAAADKSKVKRLEYGLGLSAMAATVLVSRGLGDEGRARSFLATSPADMGDVFTLPDIEPAVERMIQAVANDDHVVVLGHDDVDGITAAAIVFGALKEIGADVSYYIPDSPTEGIGLSPKLVDRFKKTGAALIVTVDCGVSSKEGVAHARSLRIDTIVTDHHEPPEELPPALAVVDAKRRDSTYDFRDLAGCGVAYRFVEAFAERYRKIAGPPSLDVALGMAALGSFADRVPLLGENRIIVANGVKQLLGQRAVPFTVLKSHIWVDRDSTMTEMLARIVPILGSSRSDEGGNLGCELLLSTEEDDAEEILSSLVMECERRKEKSRRAYERVRSHLDQAGGDSHRAVVLVEEHLPTKTVGFCASRVAEATGKPVVIISMKTDTGVGEARGPKGVDLVDALSANKRFLLGFGGHKQAAGFSIERGNVEPFREALLAYMDEKISAAMIRKEIPVDGRVVLSDLSSDNIRSLLCLEPFGEENRKPVFLLENMAANVLKEIDGSLRLGEVTLSGETLALDKVSNPQDKISLVVSPFADGSIRSMEVIDWKQA